MSHPARMAVRVTVLRRVTATDLTARQAHPQVYPCVADREASGTAIGSGRDVTHLAEVRAARRSTGDPLHQPPPVGQQPHAVRSLPFPSCGRATHATRWAGDHPHRRFHRSCGRTSPAHHPRCHGIRRLEPWHCGAAARQVSPASSRPAALATRRYAAARVVTVSWAFSPLGLGTIHSSAPPSGSAWRPVCARGRSKPTR